MTPNQQDSCLDCGQNSGPVSAGPTRPRPEMSQAGHLSLVTDARFNTACRVPNSVAMLLTGASA